MGDMAARIITEKLILEKYIMTPQGAREAVEWLVAMLAFCAIDALWATWNLWHLLLGFIL